MAAQVGGVQDVVNNILRQHDRTLNAVAEAIGATCEDIVKHAKSGHERGSDPHANDRYENQTTNLTRSIDSDIAVRPKGVDGVVFATMEYAPEVEGRYPYMLPALMANVENYEKRLRQSLSV
jgi:hypothetical protein